MLAELLFITLKFVGVVVISEKSKGNLFLLVGKTLFNSTMSSTNSKVIKVAEPVDYPLLVSFPQGVPESVSEMIVTAGRKGSDKNAKTMLTAEQNGVVFKGTDFGDNSAKKNFYNYAVGVLSPDGKLTLHPCQHAFTLRPKIENIQAPEDIATISATQRRDSLTHEFGSKKRKRALNAEKSNIILAENISAANELGTALSSSNANEEQKAELIEAAEKIISVSKRKSRGGK